MTEVILESNHVAARPLSRAQRAKLAGDVLPRLYLTSPRHPLGVGTLKRGRVTT